MASSNNREKISGLSQTANLHNSGVTALTVELPNPWEQSGWGLWGVRYLYRGAPGAMVKSSGLAQVLTGQVLTLIRQCATQLYRLTSLTLTVSTRVLLDLSSLMASLWGTPIKLCPLTSTSSSPI